MARLDNLDYDNAKANDGLPAGEEFAGRIIESSDSPTKDGQGQRLLLVFEVTEGPYKSRRHYEWLNIRNKSAEAQRIGTRMIIMIAEAVGVPVPVRDSEALHNRPLRFTLAMDKGGAGFDPKPVLKKVRAYNAPSGSQGGSQGGGSGGNAPQSPAKAGAGGDMPWD